MKIFLTGATGFVGAHVLARLVATKCEIRCLVRPHSRSKLIEVPGVSAVTGDLRDKASLARGMDGCDRLISLAGIQSSWEPRKRIFDEVNVAGTRNLMECALESGINKVVHLSTALVCGPAGRSPAEAARYTKSKRSADSLLWELHHTKGLPLVVIYAGRVVGPNNRHDTGRHIRNLASRRIRVRAFDEVVTTYVHVEDVADAVVNVLHKDDNVGQRYLLGKYQLSLKDYNALIWQIAGVPPARIAVPNRVVMAFACLATALADVTRRPPFFGISLDGLRIATSDLVFDGSAAEKQLGFHYREVRAALEEAISTYGESPR